MNTANILEQCRAVPGVTVEEKPDGAEVRLALDDGRGRMRFYALFPGVTLAQIAVDAPRWPAPQPEVSTPDARGPLIVNYCSRGRCELVLNDNRRVFQTAGQISLTERFAREEYVYPGRAYEGVELFIDPETAAEGLPLLREGFGVDIARLRERYCPDGETFFAPLVLPEGLLDRLANANAGGSAAAGRKTAVVDLLALLLSESAPVQPGPAVYYTRTQVEIARQNEQIISADLSRQHTAREFAERFSVSESSVKNYFSGVFGESISQYTAHRRMLLAAKLLRETRLSVIEVANRAGYLNQSKFSAAFRRAYGRTPLEYRREGNLAAPDTKA